MIDQCRTTTAAVQRLDREITAAKKKLGQLQTKRMRFADERRETITAAFKDGHSIADIARACSLSRQAVSKMVKQA